MPLPALHVGPVWPALAWVCLSLTGTPLRAESIQSARFAEPVSRYGHFALGRPHEYARLTVTTNCGRELTLQLPEDEVFEDLVPRIVRLAAGEPDQILAIVSQRHIGGTLKVYRQEGDALREIAALAGFSNHVYGSAELGWSAPAVRAGRAVLLVPDSLRRWLHAVALDGGKLADQGRCALPETATGALKIDADGGVSIGLASGLRHRVTGDCLN